MIIYKLTFASGKSYIGQTVNRMEHRFAQHRNAANAGSPLAVHAAWRKYGDPAFETLSAHDYMEDLHAAEIAAIVSHGCLSPGGYNLSYGGETAPSTNPEVAAKISAKAKGRTQSPERKAQSIAVLEATRNTPGYAEKVSEGLKASWTSERRAALSEKTTRLAAERKAAGWTMPQTQRDAISAAKKNPSAVTRAKMSASAKLRVRGPRSAETRAKISANTAEKWRDPEHAAKRMATMKAGKSTPEASAKQKAAAVASWADPEIRARRLAGMRSRKKES